jgi:hypothetical protein
MIDVDYFKDYRKKLGFLNQDDTKDFFQCRDIVPNIDFDFIEQLNKRLFEIVVKINAVVVDEIKVDDLSEFRKEYIDKPFCLIKNNAILPLLNNQGRRPEQVYFSWMRGFVLSNYFLKALSVIFEIKVSDIIAIGSDDFRNEQTFKRTPKADFEIKLENQKVRIEIQSGFAGYNDIKQHKVLQARKVFETLGLHSVAIHFDIYNGQVAFIKLDEICDNDINWITRQQMEGQTVLNINQNSFVWKLTEKPIKFKDIVFG